MTWSDLGDFMERAREVLAHPESAGFAGTLLSLRWAPGATLGAKAFAICCGVVSVLYVAPAAEEMFRISELRYVRLNSLFWGFSGVYLMAELADMVPTIPWRRLLTLLLEARK